MALTSYNFKKGVDVPSWHWLNQFVGGNSNPGTSVAFDEVRYMYFAVQIGTATSGSVSTTQLWRFDTWSNGWQLLVTLTSGNNGLDIEIDTVRNIIWISSGNNATEWRYFNLATTAITLLGQTIQPYSLSAAITPVLPNIPNTGASIVFIDENIIPATILTGVAGTGSAATLLADSSKTEFHNGHVGLYLRYTTGALAGQSRVIQSQTSGQSLTTAAFTGAPAVGDAYQIELPGGLGASPLAATGGSTTTLVMTGAGWTTNLYRDADVVIVGGTGIGQRRRIGSNDGTTLTLASATTGNARTGAFTTAPDATSTFRIVPSTDFVYYNPGSTSTTVSRIDVMATTPAWASVIAQPAASGGGGNMMSAEGIAPFSLYSFRGVATATLYRYDIGLQSWATPTTIWGAETMTTGSSSCIMGPRNRLFLTISASQRCYLFNPAIGTLEPFPLMPYAVPTANDGKRSHYVKTVDGVEWIYHLRSGGSEIWRIPLEWL